LKSEHPLIGDDSVDCVVSSCVLNLVRQQDRKQLFDEIFRVLRPGGRAAISDIVANEDVPADMQNDAELWSGCISGAFREDRFLAAFGEAGLHGMRIVRRQRDAWRTVRGIEFRSVTVVAYKRPPRPQFEQDRALIYRGPFERVVDDDGNSFVRGERTDVCGTTFEVLRNQPYEGCFEAIEPPESESGRPGGDDPRTTPGPGDRTSRRSDADCCGGGACG
jgi:SAM-dependent methyltransferase